MGITWVKRQIELSVVCIKIIFNFLLFNKLLEQGANIEKSNGFKTDPCGTP